jgi:hypothetical protein
MAPLDEDDNCAVRAGRRSKKIQVYHDGKAWTSRATFVNYYYKTCIAFETPTGDDHTDVRLSPPLVRRLKLMLEAHDHKVFGPNPHNSLDRFRFRWCESVRGGTWQLLVDVSSGPSPTMWIGAKTFERVFDKLKAEQRGDTSPWETAKVQAKELYAIARRAIARKRDRYEADDTCVKCHEPAPGELQADHYPTPFIDLWYAWRDAQPGGNARLHLNKDKPGKKNWRNAWKLYHNTHARYQPLCPPCHHTKSAGEKRAEEWVN